VVNPPVARPANTVAPVAKTTPLPISVAPQAAAHGSDSWPLAGAGANNAAARA